MARHHTSYIGVMAISAVITPYWWRWKMFHELHAISETSCGNHRDVPVSVGPDTLYRHLMVFGDIATQNFARVTPTALNGYDVRCFETITTRIYYLFFILFVSFLGIIISFVLVLQFFQVHDFISVYENVSKPWVFILVLVNDNNPADHLYMITVASMTTVAFVRKLFSADRRTETSSCVSPWFKEIKSDALIRDLQHVCVILHFNIMRNISRDTKISTAQKSWNNSLDFCKYPCSYLNVRHILYSFSC